MIEIPYGLVQRCFCRKKEGILAYFGNRNFVLLHDANAHVVEATLTVSDDGDYYGFWFMSLHHRFPNEIHYVFKNKDIVDACFPYGYRNEETLSRGRLVKLVVKEIS